MESFTILSEVTFQAITICLLVYFMMTITEFFHIIGYGNWTKHLSRNKASSYIFAALLGVAPGCVGAFACVTLYMHGFISLGAIVACMVATCGDEAFFLLSLTPYTALWLFTLLFSIGIIAGIITDKIFGTSPKTCTLTLHKKKEQANFTLSFSPEKIYFLLFAFLLLALGTLTPIGGHGGFRIIFITLSCLHFLLILLSNSHFLKIHLFEHIISKHLPKIFLWTWSFMLVIHFSSNYLDIGSWISANKWLLLVLACLVGIIPESGPNIIFVTLFYTQMLPFPILLANSIVQDGHGMLPLLAENKKDFFLIKAINFAIGIIVGSLFLLIDFLS